MLLLLNLNNLSLDVRVYQNRQSVFTFKTYADKLRSELEYEQCLKTFLEYQHLSSNEIDGAILSSVVPSLTNRIKNAVTAVIKKECLVVNKSLKTGLAIRMDNPNEVGTDLICETLGAVNDYKCNCLIVDMSTVVSFLLASEKKEFLGGSLFPGLLSSASAMFSNNAQLMDIELEKPKRMLGKSTKESMNAGIINGYVSLIESFSKKIKDEYQKDLKMILTGSDSSLLKDLLPSYTYNPDLIFDGLYDIYIKNN